MTKFPHMVECEPSSSGLRCVKTEWAEGSPMPDGYIDKRPVYFGDVSHGEDACDSFFDSASFADDGTDLTDADLDRLQESYSEYLAEQWFEHQIGRAEYMRDMAEDR